MQKKKSYMNISNILSEGFFEKILNIILVNPALKKNKKFQGKLKKLNTSVEDLEKMMNAELKSINPKAKKINLKQYNLKDFR